MTEKKIIQYRTEGTCCQLMQVAIENDTIVDVDFFGGCHGNLQGIKKLIIGMNIDDVINKLSGIRCGDKPTSCPDQLAQCLLQYKQKQLV